MSRTTVETAAWLKKHAPELFQKVKTDELTLSQAVREVGKLWVHDETKIQ